MSVSISISHRLLATAAPLLVALSGCPSDDAPGDEDTGSGGTDGTTSTAGGTDTDPTVTPTGTEGESGSTSAPVLPEGCDFFVEAGENGQEDLITALVDVAPMQTVCIGPGTFSLSRQLTVTEDDVTIRGMGAAETILDFSGQKSGGNGVLIEGDGNIVEDFKVIDTPGDGVRANDVDGITFSGLEVGWSEEASLENGAYALYPVQSTNVTIQDCVVYGARDAGVYLGQSTNSLVENNEAYGNVIGMEVENSTDTIVRGNHTHDNTNGFLIITLPGLDILDGKRANVYDNIVEDNNLPNFGDQGTVVGIVPEGVGILLVATDSNEIWDNEIIGNDSAAVVVVGFAEALLGVPDDPDFDLFSQSNYVHDNEIKDNGGNPSFTVSALTNGEPADLVWGGCLDAELDNSGGEFTNCFSIEADRAFINADLCMQNAGMKMPDEVDDITPYDCTHPPLPTDSPVEGG